jgi:hypothetical protein
VLSRTCGNSFPGNAKSTEEAGVISPANVAAQMV